MNSFFNILVAVALYIWSSDLQTLIKIIYVKTETGLNTPPKQMQWRYTDVVEIYILFS